MFSHRWNWERKCVTSREVDAAVGGNVPRHEAFRHIWPRAKMWMWLRLSSTHWAGSLESFLLPSALPQLSQHVFQHPLGCPDETKSVSFTEACSYWKQHYFFKASLGPQQVKGKNRDLQWSLLHIHNLPISVPHQSDTLASADDSTLEGLSLH